MLVEQLKIFREVRVDDEAEQRADDDEADREERARDLAVERALLPERHAEPEDGGHAEQEDHVVREREDERERQEPDVLALEQKMYADDEQND